MKISGIESTLLRTRDFQLRTDPPLTVRLTALPLGFAERLRMKMPIPVHPQQTITLAGKITQVPDESDSAAAMKWRRDDKADDLRVMAAYVREGLRNDPNVTWESQEGRFKTAVEYYDAVHGELEAAGFTTGEISRLFKAISELTTLDDEGMAKAKDFLAVEPKEH